MAQMYYDRDADLNHIKGKTIGVIGFGSQGHAHALNLKESGVNVVVGLYPGSRSWAKAEAAGLRVGSVDEVAELADIIMILAPDTVQKKIYEDHVARGLRDGKTLMFAHGFNIHYNQIEPRPEEIDVSMVAPKGPGHLLRRLYKARWRHARPCSPSTRTRQRDRQADRAWPTPSCDRLRPVPACSRPPSRRRPRPTSSASRPSSAAASPPSCRPPSRPSIEAGYQPESAYFETIHELKLIVDLIYEGGFKPTCATPSPTPPSTATTPAAPAIIDDYVRENMRRDPQARSRIGDFAREWILENQAGRPSFNKLREQAPAMHPSEEPSARSSAA